MRAALACLGVGVVALAGAALLGLGGAAVMPGYLAAWLFWLALPLGALALLMGMEALGLGLGPIAGALRLLLLPLPLAAVLAIPVLVAWPRLFARAAGTAARAGFAASWYAPGLVLARDVVFLVVWVLLGLLFLRPGRGRALAAPLLLLHVVMVSVAALDWVQAAEPGLGSSSFGLVLLALQAGAALSAALLLLTLARGLVGAGRALPAGGLAAGRAAASGRAAPAGAAAMLLGLLGAWAFLQFTQYLVVWSADLPEEITWYQHRGAGLGLAAEWLAGIAIVLSLVLLLPRRLGRRASVVGAVAVLLLVLHLVEMLWLVTPSWRGSLTLSLADLLALLGVGGLVLGCLLVLARRPGTELRLGLA